jgi:hypothetical protein
MRGWRVLCLAVSALAIVSVAVPGIALAADQQGAIATSHGAKFERMIAKVVTERGFEQRSYADWHDDGEPPGEWLLTNVPYVTLYGSKGRTEFLLLSAARGLRIRIEAKWQSSQGSVDEKLPHLYLNALKAMPENDVIIVIDGPGWRPGGLEWLKKAAADKAFADRPEKVVRIMDFEEFKGWAASALPSSR